MQEVEAAIVAAKSTLADADIINAIGRGRGREHRILPEQRMIITGGQYEAAFINDVDRGIKHLLLKPDGIDSDREPFAGDGMHGKTIHIFPLYHAGKRASRRQRASCLGLDLSLNSGRLRIVVRLRLGRLRKAADPKRPQLRKSLLCPQPEPMRPQRAIDWDANRRLGMRRINGRQRNHFDRMSLKPEFFGVGKLLACEQDFQFRGWRRTARLDPIDRRFGTSPAYADGQCQHGQQHFHSADAERSWLRARMHADTFCQASRSSRTLPPSTISTGRLPGANNSLSATIPRQW